MALTLRQALLRWAPVLLALSGCVTTYQPLVALQRPVAIDSELANFDGLQLLVRCEPGDFVGTEESELLCKRLRTLFSNQGAKVETEVPEEGRFAPRDQNAAKPDLIIELKARLVQSENSLLLWALNFATLTLIPAITDYTFAQEVSIRDSSGFMLSADSLQGRFVRYFGVGAWAINAMADLLARVPSERLTTNRFKEEFSQDFYGQLSQLAFHAQMRAQVLRSFEPEPPARVTP
jgi:3',5'-cyclic AMP phosphodiesterase CpdA